MSAYLWGRVERDCATRLRANSWKSKIYGAFVLNRRVDLHAIDYLLDNGDSSQFAEK